MKRITIFSLIAVCVAMISALSFNMTSATHVEMAPLSFNDMQKMVGGNPGLEYQDDYQCPEENGFPCQATFTACYCISTNEFGPCREKYVRVCESYGCKPIDVPICY